MFQCVLQAVDGTYYNLTPSLNLQEAMCFEDRSDAEWERDNNPLFKDGKIIPVIIQDDKNIVAYPTVYLVVSYKPTKHDYVRNCHMGTYDSEHEMKVFHKEEDIIEHCAKLEVKLDPLDTCYTHWIITQDMIANGYDHFDYYGKMPKSMEDKIAVRVRELKGKK